MSETTAHDDFKNFVDPDKKAAPPSEEPHRCDKCNRLLFKGNVGDNGEVTVKCGRCGTLNKFTINKPAVNFQDRIMLRRKAQA